MIPVAVRGAMLVALQAKRDEANASMVATQHAGLRDFWSQRLAEYDAAIAWAARQPIGGGYAAPVPA